jgi:hypothetical protein
MQNAEETKRTYKSWLAAGKSEADKQLARERDAESHSALKQLARAAANAECADCTATRPGWAVLPHGIFVCIDCAQLHRGIGRHISQVKAFNTGTYLWFEPELAVMREVGNAKANASFCADHAPPKPKQDAPAHVKLAYVRDKYEVRRWYADLPTPTEGVHTAELERPPPAIPPRAAPRPSTGRGGKLNAVKLTAPPPPPRESLLDAATVYSDLMSSPVQPLGGAPALQVALDLGQPSQPPRDNGIGELEGAGAFLSKKNAVLAAYAQAGSASAIPGPVGRAPLWHPAGVSAGTSQTFFAAYGL